MAKEILTPLQKKFIFLLAKNNTFRKRFYLTGGTALSAYYLNHRYSEDLDFFSYAEIEILALDIFLKELLKVEFTYFPFEPIEKPLKKDGLYIDSLTDIAVNKTFTISQNPRARDFIDLYLILKKYKKFSFGQLLKMARSKFDWQIDPIQLGTQLLKAKDLKDLPRMLHKTDHAQWRNFFLAQAKSLSKDIFKR